MRNYKPQYINCGVSKDRYNELLSFCRQYAEKKAEAETLLSLSSPKMSGMPHGSGTSDSVAIAAAKREILLNDCEMIEKCAAAIDAGIWYIPIIENVCYRKQYEFLNGLPTNRRNEYYKARQKFMILLNALKYGGVKDIPTDKDVISAMVKQRAEIEKVFGDAKKKMSQK